MRTYLFAAGLALSSAALGAGNYHFHCTRGSDHKEIVVTYSDLPETLPCEVHLRKNGTDRLLWQASVQRDYCETKARRLADQERSNGFSCEQRTGKPG